MGGRLGRCDCESAGKDKLKRFDSFCQLPIPFRPEFLPTDFAIEPKVIGHRCVLRRDRFYTWDDKLFPVETAILEALIAVQKAFPFPVLLDGVFKVLGNRPDPQDPENRERVFGVFHVFDVVRGHSFTERQKSYGYARRRKELKDVMLQRDFNRKGVVFLDEIPSFQITSDLLGKLARQKIAEGFDGIVIKDRAAFYGNAANHSWMKITIEELES